MRLERNVVYPGLPDAAGSTIRVSLEVIQESRLEISPDFDGQEGREWLEGQLGQLLCSATSVAPSCDQWFSKAAELHEQFEQRHQVLLNA